jgi:hypothetical protein
MLRQPTPQLKRDFVKVGILPKINVMDPLIIGCVPTQGDGLSLTPTVVIRRGNSYFNALLSKSARHHG